jgi:bifunctional DNase/RNase
MGNLGENLVEVKVTGVAMTATPQGPLPVALLEDPQERVLLLVMDGAQALSIKYMMDGEPVQTTHGFMLDVLNKLNVKVKKAVIYGMSGSRFLTKIALETGEGRREVEGRTGDIVALAFIANAPILVSSEILNEAAINKEELYRPLEEGEQETREGDVA